MFRKNDSHKQQDMFAALIDRVTFRAHILDMNVKESYRLEETLLKRKKNSDR
jgi:hypothetical protein